MAKYKQQKDLIFAHPMKNNQQIKGFLESFDNLNITTLFDENKSSVLHRCAFENRKDSLTLYIQYMRQYYKKKNEPNVNQKLKEWINMRNIDGFGALHYASYKGNISVMKYLLQLGANLQLRTTNEHSMLHISAQGNTVKTFIYLRGKKDINQVDQKNSTSLHWAAYKNSENVVEYLLAQPQIKINEKDIEGQTPLHLAAAYGNSRVVRRLLIAGADRNIFNNGNKTPIQIAKESEYWTIYNMLNDKYSLFDYLKFYYNIKMNINLGRDHQ